MCHPTGPDNFTGTASFKNFFPPLRQASTTNLFTEPTQKNQHALSSGRRTEEVSPS